ncbi:MAG: glycogen debranching enzyme N-terminal domain-containing protein, partial [Desulfovibrionaceae bacterium]|nr:glycogen debranching enzyme N-terminal domain-containing protein [Desulfovibrionaceae bacterium]
MSFVFDKAECQNIRKALRKEWLLTNGCGDYSSSTILGCNTRKYHGLLVVNVPGRSGRFVLLSCIEMSVLGGGKEFCFSSRKHPGVFHPHGYEYLDRMEVDDWPKFHYRLADLFLTREFILLRKRQVLLIRSTVRVEGAHPPLTLRIKPLLAFRHFHGTTRANPDVNPQNFPAHNGVRVQPYPDLPPLFMQGEREIRFHPAHDWYYNVEYLVEEERGFPYSEDLFNPGMFESPIAHKQSSILAVGTEEVTENLRELWEKETGKRQTLMAVKADLDARLVREASRFLIADAQGNWNVIAGYHWFDCWGRDALISLPGLTFCAGRMNKGVRVLQNISRTMQDGLVPNYYSGDGNHAWNSADASLWYVWAVQKMLAHAPEHLPVLREEFWPKIKEILVAYRQGKHRDIYTDDACMLHVGSANTQMTWMDAKVNGRPVTPRYGCPVEMNALWYNALAFGDYLGQLFKEPDFCCPVLLRKMREVFRHRFWINRRGGYLADVWRDGQTDGSIRPNQIFAISLPYPVLEEELQPFVVECVRNHLLTPFGLRTLSPNDAGYEGGYEGPPEKRDAAYHQGTVWPWLLGHYAEALLRVAWDIPAAVSGLLGKVTPLFTQHLREAGLGSISEIFDGSPPH